MTVDELQKIYLSPPSKVRVDPADFFILLAHITKKERAFLLAHPEYSLSVPDETIVRDFLARRLQRESVASIVGYKEFYGYDFIVTRDTLIPRPETEILVELAIKSINKQLAVDGKQKIAIIDVGTGSGNIIISLAKEITTNNLTSDIAYYATDISTGALAIAIENSKRQNVDNLIQFHESDLLESIKVEISSEDVVIIVANLPYLSESIYKDTSLDVRNFEPMSALVSEESGLSHYYRLLRYIKESPCSKNSLILFLEISPEQALTLKHFILSLFSNAKVHIHTDLAKKDRIVEIIL